MSAMSGARRSYRFPLRVENLLSQAGESVYAWYSSELAQHLDPSGRLQRMSRLIECGAFLGSVALATFVMAVASGHLVSIPTLGLAYVLVNGVAGRGLLPAPWKVTLLLTALSVGTAVTDDTGQGVWTGIGVVLCGFLLTRVVMHHYRDSAVVAFHVGSALSGVAAALLTGPGAGAGWVALAGGFVAGWFFAFVRQGRRAMSALPVRLRAEQFSWALPDPPSRIPLLLRRRARRFEREGAAQRKIGARSSEDAAIDMKKIGGAGERKTGLLLLGLERGRWTRIVHDVAIPGATQGGNADHVVLARSGGWVLDSKQFGSKKDPGVVRRTNTGEIVHVSSGRSRDLEQTLRTVAWAVRGIRQEMQVPFRGMLVVHNAEVEHGLSVLVKGRGPTEGNVTVDIISAQHLVAYLDLARPVMTPWEVSAAHWGLQAKLVSATTGLQPQMVAPIGGGPKVMPAARPVQQDRADMNARGTIRAGVEGWLGRVSPARQADPPPELETEVLPADPIYPGEGPSDFVQRRVDERWEQVEVSEPAAPDDVPPEMRDVQRGTSLSHIGFTEDFSDVVSIDLVALSGPCQGLDGPFVWACPPPQWAAHKQTGKPVMADTFSLEHLAVRPDEEVKG